MVRMGRQNTRLFRAANVVLIVGFCLVLLLMHVGLIWGLFSNAPGLNHYSQPTAPYSMWFVTGLTDALLLICGVFHLRCRPAK